MKNICICCGDCANGWYNNPPRLFCSKKCTNYVENRRPLDIRKHFDIFQHIVARADNYKEFAQLYKKYFRGDD